MNKKLAKAIREEAASRREYLRALWQAQRDWDSIVAHMRAVFAQGLVDRNNPEDIEAFKKQCNPLGEIEKEKVDKAIREALDTIKPGSGKGAL